MSVFSLSMTYGSETWTLPKSLAGKFRVPKEKLRDQFFLLRDKKNFKLIREQTMVDDIINTVIALK